ncbi:hypothetical protein [Spiroplasma endosymbiont of Agriotes lineatus]|uniref:hypothetical protein n=1 Tax=Spiroplasma endosymbiont of Agriotes lineatus TaxID=3077930 RepID=UPI0030D02FD4
MHPAELGNSYVLTFYLTVLKGKNNDDDNLTKLYGIHKFDNLQFSFNVNENYENKGRRAIVPDIVW